ncbi:pirin family protein [Nitrososphaera viennensis]|uniref:Pirin domain protein n=2 Tax=Nitrososphaera viennensis TaxID=1034015 RepID=A0A060HPV1_9ARCH|nr:pirin family protein [Nitrososphaera viennensis]AIC15581.1 pirin domain protein [Nitrososphaera viennensis EN76]UVS70457.1 pirin family protein [Nitrososphaera viennensis]
MTITRSVKKIVNSIATMEGEGFLVHRSFPTNALMQFDPFLLLDEMGPKEYGPGEAKGAPDHPHRGFETVTYMLEGSFQHKDSNGSEGRLGPGDVQWMTAGAGVVHSEMPAKEFAGTGGRLHGFQLWVNLPKRDKMAKPRYQDIPAAKIPVASAQGANVRVIAGEALGKKAVIDTRTPIMYLHYTLKPGARIEQQVPREYNAFAYVVEGEGEFGKEGGEEGKEEKRAKRGQMAIFERDGDSVSIAAPKDAASDLSVLLIGGVPLNEPVARYGPFVMNTQEEIYQAIEDYRAGRFGRIGF